MNNRKIVVLQFNLSKLASNLPLKLSYFTTCAADIIRVCSRERSYDVSKFLFKTSLLSCVLCNGCYSCK